MTDSSGADLRDAAAIISFNDNVIAEFRATGGHLGGPFEGAPVLLLTHLGAKSGVRRVCPLFYTEDADRLIVVASNAGAPAHPQWYVNVVANPAVAVERGSDSFPATARVAVGSERARLFRDRAEVMPNLVQYQAQVTREIPVVVLERV